MGEPSAPHRVVVAAPVSLLDLIAPIADADPARAALIIHDEVVTFGQLRDDAFAAARSLTPVAR